MTVKVRATTAMSAKSERGFPAGIMTEDTMNNADGRVSPMFLAGQRWRLLNLELRLLGGVG